MMLMLANRDTLFATNPIMSHRFASRTKIEDQGCQDVDECLHNKGGCERRCNNTFGGFECLCEVGWELNDDMRTCTGL